MTRESTPFDTQSGGAGFAVLMRQRAEQAVAASIHHASLSQQYLALSQKYAALAEQAATGEPVHGEQIARALDREALTGAPSGPLGCIQIPALVPAPAAGMNPFAATDPASWRVADTAFPDSAVRKDKPPNGIDHESEAATRTVPPTETADPSRPKSDPSASSAVRQTVARTSAAVPRLEQQPGQQSGQPPGREPQGRAARQRRRKRRVVVAKDLVRQLYNRVPVASPDVKIRARKSDLKPRLRTAVDELKVSRRPAAFSALICSVIVALLAMLRLTFAIDPPLKPIVASFSSEVTPVEEALPIEPPDEEAGEQTEVETVEEPEEPEEEVPEPEPEDAMASESAAPEEPPMEPVPNSNAPASSLPAAEDGDASKTDGRTAEGREAMLKKYGGSAASESAVQAALQWLVSVQRRDGSWDFADVGASGNPGSVVNPIGGTAYALLPFLAAGQTHQKGEYRASVLAGLNYLTQAGVRVPAGYDLRGVLNKGNTDSEPNEAYYVHGAATLALCEALWMTRDRRLRGPAEGAVRFLLSSQDPRGGGWRYLPLQPGSTSVTTIQVMALTAAQKAGLPIPDSTWHGVTHYLDSVQIDGQGRYGYEVEKKSYQASLTAMALLNRIYLGWQRDDGDLRAGIALLDRKGPYDNLYYNYFATQVLRHWGGEEWQRWNERLRDDLVRWQEAEGPAAGSWTPRDRADYSVAGGRLLSTCLATLTLEVYYRYESPLPDAPPAAVASPAAEVHGAATGMPAAPNSDGASPLPPGQLMTEK